MGYICAFLLSTIKFWLVGLESARIFLHYTVGIQKMDFGNPNNGAIHIAGMRVATIQIMVWIVDHLMIGHV